ncbi:MAG TPA: hypothetical protein VGR35_09870 [Tepidisphaeraceae bacterium]|nr:hypothetical protein [Tepidisphaeraceae bacterium]
MERQDDLVVMTPDVTVSTAVDGVLGSNGRVWTKTTLRSLRDLLLHLGRATPAVALVDVDPHPRQVLAELERASARFPAVRFVALSSVLNNDLLLAAMQSGVRHVVVKQTLLKELPELLHRLTGTTGTTGIPRGNVFGVLSAGGGCGATVLAVNLADELAARTGQPSLLIDLDTSYGTVASYLGIEAQYGVDYLLSYGGPIDAHLIRSTATVHNDRIHVLPSPASINFSSPQPLALERLDQLLEAAAEAYGAVVIDAPRVSVDVAAALAAATSRCLLAMQLIVKDLRVARMMVAALTERGVSNEAVLPIVTRYARRQHMITLEEASKALGDLPVKWLRNDYHGAAQAMNFGQTLAEAVPRSSLRKDIQELATHLTVAQPAAR